MRVGIPQSLLYFKYGNLWKKRLNAVGAEVIISPETTEDILSNGINHSISDLCLPVKSFFGHVLALKDDVDCLFIPRMIRIEPDAYLCPKFIGLPDMVRAAIRNLPAIIDTAFNIKEQPSNIFWHEVLTELKKLENTSSPDKKISGEIANLCHSSDEAPVGRAGALRTSAKKLTIGIAGRPYLVLDNHINKGVLRYIRSLGIETSIMSSLDKNYIADTMEKLPKWVYWSMGKDVVSTVRWMLDDNDTDGIILLSTAGCGPDSFVAELIEQVLFVEKKPYMHLKIDEHTSDVGLKTRIEAFIDMLERSSRLKKQNLRLGIEN